MKTDYFIAKSAQGHLVEGTIAHTIEACRAKAQSKPQAVCVSHIRINLEVIHADAAAWETTKNVFRWEGLTA